MNILMVLKLILPIVIISLVWIWNKKRREEKLVEEDNEIEVPHYEFGVLDDRNRKRLATLPEISEILNNLEGTARVYQVVLEEETIAAIIFSWPSSLWHFRIERDESETLNSYSHIHWVGVEGRYQKQGHLHRLMDMVISDTHRISSGITIDLKDLALKDLFRREFEFKDFGTYMKLDYDNWS